MQKENEYNVIIEIKTNYNLMMLYNLILVGKPSRNYQIHKEKNYWYCYIKLSCCYFDSWACERTCFSC